MEEEIEDRKDIFTKIKIGVEKNLVRLMIDF